MGRIKSALEIALERTESVKSDRAGIDLYDAKQRGKKLANEFLADPELKLEEAFKKAPKEQLASLKQGFFDALISQINLPSAPEDALRLETAGKGLQAVINNSRFSALHKQMTQAVSQYLDQAAQYEEAIRRQYAPKLRQKEEELSRRMGREVRLDPFQDPEFIAFFNQHINALKGNYEAVLTQFREEAIRLFEASPS
ncbi:MAG: hypothetical protein LBK74_09890 [Treponema sp.]|jgi:hypothetical protein|nr:hypothetical protein [Treponema sp.]